MHTKEMSELDGSFGAKQNGFTCPRCKQNTMTCRNWESDCGGFEDYKYECSCGYSYWVEGPDS